MGWGLCLSVALATSLHAQGRALVPEGSNFHNGASFPLAARAEARELLDRLEHALVVADPEEAAFALRGLRHRREVDLVDYGPRTLVPALDRAASRVMSAEQPALRERVIREQRDALAALVAERDLDGLLDHATRGLALPTSRDAAQIAARFLFEQGRWWDAEVLARRAGSDALAELCAARQQVHATPAPWPGPWTFGFSHRYTAQRLDTSGLPFARDGFPGEVLIADDNGLQGLDLRDLDRGAVPARPDFPYAGGVLGQAGRSALPAPLAHELVGPLTHLVQAFDIPISPDWRSPIADREARLLCVDASELRPRRRWMTRIAPWVERGTSSAASAPLVVNGRVFALTFAQDLVSEVRLVSLDLADGEVLFDTPLVAAPIVPRFASRQAQFDARDLDKRGPGSTLLERDGLIYASTGRGALAAIDALTGWPRFVFRYDRLFSLDPDLYDRSYLYDTGGWDDEPVRASDGRLILAPPDSRYLYSLEPQLGPAGQLIREDPIERFSRRHIVGLMPDPRGGEAPALLLTERRLRRSGVVLLGADGVELSRSENYPSGEEFVARPVATSTHALVPTTRGVRVHRLDALHESPELLRLPPAVPPLGRLIPLADGLLGLCPENGEPGNGVVMVWWAADRP
ncbi:MAG: hypothetical protein DHS20C15_10940 [Planctomycetota bacterium]|nr:MAG: hypothetical protein DHS20C15_10940 [Planctomycetota bacterium]